MRRSIPLLALATVILLSLGEEGRAEARRWRNKTWQRATAAAFLDPDIRKAAETKFGYDNDCFGFQVTELNPVPGGKEFEVQLIFDAVGTVPDRGDIEAIVFVSTGLSSAYVVSFDDPASDPLSGGGGGEINNAIEYRAAAEAFGDDQVQAALDSRFDQGVEFIDVDVTIIDTAGNGTTVRVFMDSDSNEEGKGDVTARVLVGPTSATVIDVEGE